MRLSSKPAELQQMTREAWIAVYDEKIQPVVDQMAGSRSIDIGGIEESFGTRGHIECTIDW